MDLEQTRAAVAAARERATDRWARLAGPSTCRLDGPDAQRLAAKEAEGAVQALRLAGRHLDGDGRDREGRDGEGDSDAPATRLERARREWLTTPAGRGPAAEAYRAGGTGALDRIVEQVDQAGCGRRTL